MFLFEFRWITQSKMGYWIGYICFDAQYTLYRAVDKKRMIFVRSLPFNSIVRRNKFRFE